MKGIYLSFALPEELGVRKKIKSQIKALKEFSIDIKEIRVEKNFLYFENKIVNKYRNGTNLKNKILRKLDLYICLHKLKNKKFYEGIDFIYIRYFFTSPWSLSYFKFLKKIGIKIILEMPTYPYDGEIQKENFFTKWDKKYRKFLNKYIDKIVTYSNDNSIFEIETIKINNGINLKQMSIVKRNMKKDGQINFIIVAQIAFWHGIDRFILSMAEYYKNNPKEIIKFHIVGDGSKKILNNLKEIIRSNKLEKYVTFYGYKSGKDLDEIYNKADIAVGSLGFSRATVKEGSPLKTREYIAKGLPVVLGYSDLSLKNTLDFIYQVPNDESIFDLYKILNWYRNLESNSIKIRKYAEDNLTWDKQMKKVVDYILETKEKEKC